MAEKKNQKWKWELDEKKEKFIIFILAGFLLLIVCIPVNPKQKNKNTHVTQKSYSEQFADSGGQLREEIQSKYNKNEMEMESDIEQYRENLEQRLSLFLQCMDGVGRTKVMITFRSSGEEIVEKDRPVERTNLSENDGTGGNRSSNDLSSGEETVFVTDEEGRRIPYVRKRMEPVVEGVTVLAEGGNSEAVKKNISETIQALFDVDENKIKIAKMKTSK